MSRSKSSKSWLKEHHGDEFVKQSRRDGYRSRAVYKLKELDDRYHLIKPAHTIIDLGAAPGGWSQYAMEHGGAKTRVIALDILDMPAITGVEFIQGDFREDEVLERLREIIAGQPVDLVMSDMAPNISGMKAVDQPRAMYLAELALALVDEVLDRKGNFLVKVFQGEGFDQYIRDCRERFNSVVIKKPEASRARSREVYVLGRDYSV